MKTLLYSTLFLCIFSSCQKKPSEKEIKAVVADIINAKVEFLDFNVIKCDKYKANDNDSFDITFTAKYRIADTLASYWPGDIYEIESDEFVLIKTYSGKWWTDKKEFRAKRIELGTNAIFKDQKFIGLINNSIPVEIVLSTVSKDGIRGNIKYGNETHEASGSITENGLIFFDIERKEPTSDNKFLYYGNEIRLTKLGDTYSGKTTTQDGISSSFEMKKLQK